MSRRPVVIVCLIAIFVVVAAPARAEFPEEVVAGFCRADGRGERLSPAGAAIFGEFLPWRFEPAWDRIVVISGHEVNPVRVGAEDAEVLIRYGVLAEITGEGVRDETHQETARLTLAFLEGAWRLIGPPPAPHLYLSSADREQLFALLMPVNPGYVSNSKFVWRMFQNAGWDLPYQPTSALLGGSYFKVVGEPRLGDVVAYLNAGVPYHVGIYEGEDRVASATFNHGIVRAAINTFPGEVRYLRLTEAARPRPPGAERPAPPAEAPAIPAEPAPPGDDGSGTNAAPRTED